MEAKTAFAAVAVLVILAIIAGAFILLSTPAKTPNLTLTAALPASSYAGEAYNVSARIANTGSAAADGAVVQLTVDGVILAQRSVSLAPGAETNVSFAWLASTAGNHAVRIVVDAANAIAESNENDNAYAATLNVAARDETDLFSLLPDSNIVQAYYVNTTVTQLAPLIGVIASGASSNAALYAALANRQSEGRLALLQYGNDSRAEAFEMQSELTQSEFVALAENLTNETMLFTERNVSGRMVAYLENPNQLVTTCIWNEGGWGRVLSYTRFFAPVILFNESFGENTTCLDVLAGSFGPANARAALAPAANLSRAINTTGTFLDGAVASGSELLYARGFTANGATFLALISSTGTPPAAQECAGDVLNVSGTPVCHIPQASVFDLEFEAYERRQGNYTMLVLIAPSTGNTQTARETALAVLGSISLGGQDYAWGTIPEGYSLCSFNNTLACNKAAFLNGTMSLDFTSLSSADLNITGFKCTLEDAPTPPFALSSPVELDARGDATVAGWCYANGSVRLNATGLVHLNLFANLTNDQNVSRIVNGTLTANVPE